MERGSESDAPAPSAPGAPRSAPAWAWFLLGFVLPALLLFWEALTQDRNFAYRDAAHFYYPYYKLIAEEWRAGRLPLWNPYENGGEPLAAQPTAAVWYPPKLVFVLPFPLAFKLYHLGHLALAWWTMYFCARSFRLSRGAAAFAGTGYAFSGYVLFQIYNVVFLVGAAWLPLGIACVDRLVRRPGRGPAFGLAAVLAMQVLGGDPEVAMLTLIIALPYLLLYHYGRRGFWWGVGLLGLGHAIVFFTRCLTPFEFMSDAYMDSPKTLLALDWLAAAAKYPGALLHALIAAITEPSELPLRLGASTRTLTLYFGWTGPAALLLGVILLARGGGFRTLWKSPALRSWLTAAVMAMLLSAIQVLPTRDLVNVSDRVAPKAPREPAAFSLFPARILELALPAAFGKQFPSHTRWAPFSDLENGLWTATLYAGLPLALLGFAMLRWRRAEPTIVWLTWTFLLMFWLAIGKFGGLYWMFDPVRNMLDRPIDVPRDAKMYGATDGLYRLCEEAIPLFASFRYPEKCFLFCTLVLALLAAFAIDSQALRLERFRKALTWTLGLLALLLLSVWIGRSPFEHFIESLKLRPVGWGPFDPQGASRVLLQSLTHGLCAVGALLAITHGRGRAAGWLVLLLAADLATGNRWLVMTESQADIDAEPKLLTVIKEAEARQQREPDALPEPYRIHRTRIYTPFHFRDKSDVAADTANWVGRVMNRWERNTLQPKYGVPRRLAYAITAGTMSVYDVEFFFAPWPFTTPEPIRRANPDAPIRMTYFPRVGYNLWGAKYFILPNAIVLDHDERGVFTLMGDANGLPAEKLASSDPNEDDYVLVKNPEAFPRAWVVHEAEVQPPIFGLRREDRTRTMERLLFRARDRGMEIWHGGVEYPLAERVHIEAVDKPAVLRTSAGGAPSAAEKVRFLRDDPGHLELEATLDRPGYIVLSNVYYRGWSAAVDNTPTPILRANRAMQAIPLLSGRHHITLTYSCRSTLIGALISALTWLYLLLRSLPRRTKG